jgi:hypothetical protein
MALWGKAWTNQLGWRPDAEHPVAAAWVNAIDSQTRSPSIPSAFPQGGANVMPGLRPGSSTGADAWCDATRYCQHQIDGGHRWTFPQSSKT